MSYTPERVHELSVLYDLYEGLLAPRQREVLDLKLSEDLSLLELSLRLGITRQGCEDALKRGVRALFRFDSILGLSSKATKDARRAKEILEILAGMDGSNWEEGRDRCVQLLSSPEEVV